MKSDLKFTATKPMRLYVTWGFFSTLTVVSIVAIFVIPDVIRAVVFGAAFIGGGAVVVGGTAWAIRQSQQIHHQAEMNRFAEARARYFLIPKSTVGVIDLDSHQPLALGDGRQAGRLVIEQPAVEKRRSVLDLLPNGPHFSLIGGTNSGKTTLANHLIDAIADSDTVVFALDPDAKFNIWSPRCQIVDSYEAIEMALRRNFLEMERRRDAGPGDYPLIIIAMDEWPAVVDECDRVSSYLKRLSRQGRKVGFRLILLSQSDLVEDIGNNSAVRENFVKISMRPDLTRQNLATIRHWDKSTELIELAGTYGKTGRWLNAPQPAGLSLPEPEDSEADNLAEFVALVQSGLSKSEASQRVFGKPYAGTSHVQRLREALLLAEGASTG